MSPKLTGSFAMKNLRSNRHLNIPFVLSGGIMLILFYIMASLLDNTFVLERHADLIMFARIGVVLIWIFSTVFIMYGNRFLMARRNKELALYGILGLEKKHIRRILFLEEAILFGWILVIAEVGGIVLSRLAYLGLGRLMGGQLTAGMTGSLSAKGVIYTAVLAMFLFLLVYMKNVLVIKNVSPIALLSMQHKGEGEPKTRYILLTAGILCMGYGYYLALTTEGTLASINKFFIAVFAVIFGTYFLFVALSIFILKQQRKNKAYYYRPAHFLSISGMLYRMKSNAVSLASIAILSTCVVVAVSTTYTIYGASERTADSVFPKGYSISSFVPVTSENEKQVSDALRAVVDNANRRLGLKAEKEPVIQTQVMVPAAKEKDRLVPLAPPSKNKETRHAKMMYAVFMPLSSYNGLYDQSETLGENEALIGYNARLIRPGSQMELMGKSYSVRDVGDIVPGNLAIEAYVIVLPTLREVEEAAAYYEVYDAMTGDVSHQTLHSSVWWDMSAEAVAHTPEAAKAYMESVIEKGTQQDDAQMGGADIRILTGDDGMLSGESHTEQLSFLYGLNGGFLALGIIVGAMFLVGTILMIYYKQISEGTQDRQQYQIMKKVGLPDELIRKTASYQVVWMFFLPLAVACLHALVASRILFQLVSLFGVHEFTTYGKAMAVTVGIFVIVYFIVYRITSRVYYRLVS